MFLRSLPATFNLQNEVTPPVYHDHFLFSENLQQPYECPEHTAAIGLLITGRGTCNYHVNGMKNPVSGHQVCFISRGSRLAVRITEKETAPALLFFDSRLPDLVQHSLNYADEALLEEPFDDFPYDFSYMERIHMDRSLHQAILSLIPIGGSCSSFASLKADMIIRGLFEDLLRQNREAYKHSQNIQAVKASTRIEIFKRVSLAKDWVEENYHTDITLEDMAAVAAMNSQHFLRMFRQVYHITPHQYLIDRRLRQARHLLDSTQLTITEICHAIGFESVFSFSILFKGRFGLSPAHFRKG